MQNNSVRLKGTFQHQFCFTCVIFNVARLASEIPKPTGVNGYIFKILRSEFPFIYGGNVVLFVNTDFTQRWNEPSPRMTSSRVRLAVVSLLIYDNTHDTHPYLI